MLCIFFSEELSEVPVKKAEDGAAAPSVASFVEEKDDAANMDNTPPMVEVKPKYR